MKAVEHYGKALELMTRAEEILRAPTSYDGSFDEFGYLEGCDDATADRLIGEAITALGGGR